MTTATLYGNFLFRSLNGDFDLPDNTIKVALCTSSYTPNQDTHVYFSDITNEHTGGVGYTAGGDTLATKSLTYTTGTNIIAFDAADTVWGSSTITARYAVVYRDTGTASTSPLIMYVDFVTDQSSASQDFKIEWNTGGLWEITVAT